MSHRDPAASLDALLAHREWVSALARTLVSDPHAAEDLEQQTWLAAVRQPPRRWTTPRAWLGTVARRTASKMRRTRARDSARLEHFAQSEAASSAADLAAKAEIHERVVHTVLALPEPYRSVILFRFFEGLAPREIARRMNAPVNTVRAQVRRGIERLREQFGRERGADWQATLLPLVVFDKTAARGGRTAGGLAMATHSQTPLLVAALLLLAASLVTWAVRTHWGGAAPRTPRTSAQKTTPPAPPSAEPAPVEKATRPHPATDEALIFGRVLGPEAAEVTPGSFYATGEWQGTRRLLKTRTELQSDSFRTKVSLPNAAATWAIDFGVAGRGFVRQVRHHLQVAAGRGYRVDFTLKRGPALLARVVDGSGEPVADLEILLRPLQVPPWGLTSAGLLDTRPFLLAPPGQPTHFARARTDADGRFAVHSLGPGSYGIFSTSGEWILEHPEVLRPGDQEAKVTAVPAHSVVGTVRDAATNFPIDRAQVTIALRTATGQGWVKTGGISGGRLLLAWKPAAEEVAQGFLAEVSVAAPGYLTQKKSIPFPPGTRRSQVAFQLEAPPARELASLLVEVVDPRGKRVDLELSFRLDPQGEPAAPLEVASKGPGLFRLRAPPGRRTLQVAPRRRLGSALQWTGVLEWRAGQEQWVRCELPAFGIVRIRKPGSVGRKKPWLVIADPEEANHDGGVWQTEREEIRFAAVPGLWHFGSDAPQVARRTVTVRPGAEVVLTLGE